MELFDHYEQCNANDAKGDSEDRGEEMQRPRKKREKLD